MMIGNKRKLNVAAELARSMANGPGCRYVVWVQGCPFVCPGCFNPDYQPLIVKKIVKVEELVERILSVGGIEGVTFSGGEPMIQAEALYLLSTIVKKHGLTIFCYTGYTLQELYSLKNPFVKKLLSQIDILIDGRYEKENKSCLLWRGSTNQKVHFLTNVYACYKSQVEVNQPEMEILIGSDKIIYTGMLQEEIITRLNQLLLKEEV